MQTKVIYGEQEIGFDLKKSSRNKVEITVLPDATIEVKAPESCALEDVKSKVLKRARWILKTRDEMEAHNRDVLPRQYISGENHFYLGRRYMLKVTLDEKAEVKLLRGKIELKAPKAEQVPNLLNDWYRSHALKYFQGRLQELSSRIPWIKDSTPPLKLLTMKKQWGSCSPEGRIILNPHLVKAPRDCVDYVILHEICHLQEHNHSQRFYQLLGQLMPNWKEIKTKLDGMAEVYLNV